MLFLVVNPFHPGGYAGQNFIRDGPQILCKFLNGRFFTKKDHFIARKLHRCP
jgi:hypothetical protein